MFSPSSAAPFHATPARLFTRITLSRGIALWRSRRALGKLTRAQLDDIGLSVEQAQKEAGRPIWDAPSHWYR